MAAQIPRRADRERFADHGTDDLFESTPASDGPDADATVHVDRAVDGCVTGGFEMPFDGRRAGR